MAADRRERERRERERKRQDQSKMGHAAWEKQAQQDAEAEREERKQSSYTQPMEASFRQFLEYRGWTPRETDEMPDDWLYSEWMRYVLQMHYGIPLQNIARSLF